MMFVTVVFGLVAVAGILYALSLGRDEKRRQEWRRNSRAAAARG